jgi:hypothetical protein
MHEKSKRGFAKEKKRGFSSRQENPIWNVKQRMHAERSVNPIPFHLPRLAVIYDL